MQFVKKIRDWNKLRKAARNKPKIYFFPDQFAYIPIPKCATRSMYDLLGGWVKDTYSKDLDKFGYHLEHVKLEEMSGSVYTFTIVRDPVERLYSAYKNKVLIGEGSAKKIFLKNTELIEISILTSLYKLSVKYRIILQTDIFDHKRGISHQSKRFTR